MTAATAAINVWTAGYLGVLTASAALPRRRLPPGNASTRFAILVPAHNEETVIADTLASLNALEYDRQRFSVHVVADNCSDRTTELVRISGWNAHERVAPDDPGKGPALNWLFDRIDQESAFDAVVIIDADTVVEPDFLTAMDSAFANGAIVAQGFYSVRDPEASTAAAIRFAALACRHHLRPLGRTRLGASCGLYGNGMAFRRDVLRRRRWTGHLIEDAEFQMELLLGDGIRVAYVPDARLEAEMPATLDAATSQNERWERGRVDLARRYVPRLIRRLPAARGCRIAHVDAVVDHLLPPLSTVVAAQLAGIGAAALTTISTPAGSRRRPARLAALQVVTLGVIGVHVVSGLRSVSAPSAVYRSMRAVPRTVLWKLTLWARVLGGRRDVAWQRTPRNAEADRGSGAN